LYSYNQQESFTKASQQAEHKSLSLKIALITDTHWGVRNDNAAFMDNSKRFLDEIFFPYLSNNSVSTVVHLGDLVDRRKYININTAKRLREDFLDKLKARDLDVHIIAGNHDTYFKNTNEVNSLRELLPSYSFKIYDQLPREVEFDGTIVLMLPWICDENRQLCLDKFRSTPAQIVMGHLELAGFEMYRGSMVSHGDDRTLFDRFDMVLSGHYHHRSSDGSIHYLGSHAEFTWSDYDDRKGFHILDTETKELTFIENPYKMFAKIWYDDLDKQMNEILDIDFDSYKSMMVKVIVTNKTNPYFFDLFIDKLEKAGLNEIQIVEDHLNLGLIEDDSIVDEAESTLDIFKKHIQQVKVPNLDKERLEKTIVDLYQEALTVE
jgi:DNA repair exonuclease SbcCD nuclease subunit